jgi:hypothetical protein
MQLAWGDAVRVKTATGEHRKGRVIGFGDGVVYVTTEAEYQRARSTGKAIGEFITELYVGFPTEDVFAESRGGGQRHH